ncbi:invasion associated locus B family protein [Microvirga massiliensis]|uniref:invasion associated locus B family protein n=1 Tax=Microvirga massiliensis TaxID=1033741 RepID=UPI00062B974C|nr:invasion associated locus B family protein [Microvirga massiliensis]
MSFSRGLTPGVRSGTLIAALMVAAGSLSAAAQNPSGQENQSARASAEAPVNPGPTVIAVQPHPSQPDWTKICNGEPEPDGPVCYTTRDFVSTEGQPLLAVGLYDIKGQKDYKLVRILLPLGLLMPQGIRIAIDQDDPIPGKFSICLPNGCFAEVLVDPKAISSLKDGRVLTVGVQNQIGREVAFVMPVTGLGKALEGDPIDPQALAEQQRKLHEELQKRAEDARAQ